MTTLSSVCRLTADLIYAGAPAPKIRYQFFGNSQEECLAQLSEQGEVDQLLADAIAGRVNDPSLALGWKTVELAKVSRGTVPE